MNESILAVAALGVAVALTIIVVDTFIVRRIRRQAVAQETERDETPGGTGR